MTRLQKQIFYYLFSGCTIYNLRNECFYIRTGNNSFAGKFYYHTYRKIASFLRKNKKGLLELNKSEVLKLRGNSWIKKEYKKSRGQASMTFLFSKERNKPIFANENESQLTLF